MQGAQQAGEALQAGFDGGAPAPGGHALEAAVDRMQARAHALIPGVYTHAHRYVPSDTVWCVAGAMVVQVLLPRKSSIDYVCVIIGQE